MRSEGPAEDPGNILLMMKILHGCIHQSLTYNGPEVHTYVITQDLYHQQQVLTCWVHGCSELGMMVAVHKP